METIDEGHAATDGRATPPWSAFGIVVTVLVASAFATGWHLGRRWVRLMG